MFILIAYHFASHCHLQFSPALEMEISWKDTELQKLLCIISSF